MIVAGGAVVDADSLAALALHPDGPDFGRPVREAAPGHGAAAVWHCPVRVVACGGLGSSYPAATPHYPLPFGIAKVWQETWASLV